MSLKDTLRADVTVALKARDELTLTTLRSFISALESAEKGGKTAVVFDDQAVQKLLRTQIKQRKESAPDYIKAGRPEGAERELAEAAVLEGYLPTALDDEELESLVATVIAGFEEAPSSADFGSVMKQVVAAAEGRADGGRISKAVKSALV